jgi:ABC-type uncharacterized transport system involved in gliding motility auxiliary subunit
MRAYLEKISTYIAYFGGVALLSGLTLYAITQQLDTKVEALLAMGLALLGLYILAKPEEVKKFLVGRTIRYGSNALVMSVAFVGILALVNFLSNRHHYRQDLTANQQFSLSPQTIQVLQGLKEPIKLTAFFSEADPYQQEAKQGLEDLLREYTAHTNKLTYEFIDPDQNPALARQYQITTYGTVVLERGAKRQETLSVDEQGLTSAIVKVSSDEVKGVYFTSGHKEHDPNGYREDGYSQIKDLLEKDNYKVEVINLATVTDTLPSDLAVLVIAAPQTPFDDRELERLDNYLNEGGKALIMSDPNLEETFDDELRDRGLRLRDDVIIDPTSSFFGDVASPLVNNYNFSQITKDLSGLATFYPLARSVEKLENAPEGLQIVLLAQSSQNSWGETNLQQKTARYEQEQDTKGPLTIAASVEGGEAETRLVVFGDSDFVTNGLLGSVRGFGNVDLFLNTVNWLAEEEELISIRPKSPDTRQIVLTPPQMRLILYSSAGFLPLVILAIGATVWWQRR